MMSAIKSWLPDWAQRIAGVAGEPKYDLCRCSACGGATLLMDGTTGQGEEIRRCVRCGILSKGEQ